MADWTPGDLAQLSDGSLAVVRGGPFGGRKIADELEQLREQLRSMGVDVTGQDARTRKRLLERDGKITVAKLSKRTALPVQQPTPVPADELRRFDPPGGDLVLDRDGWRMTIISDGIGPFDVPVELHIDEGPVVGEYARPAGRGGFQWSESIRQYLSDVLQLEAAHWIERRYRVRV